MELIENSKVKCQFCGKLSDNQDWEETTIFCEDCGEHPAIRCPKCDEVVDLVMNLEPSHVNLLDGLVDVWIPAEGFEENMSERVKAIRWLKAFWGIDRFAAKGQEMKFSEEFNEWLIEQGEEPWDENISEILDEAVKGAVTELKEHEAELVAFGKGFGAGWVEAIEKRNGAR